MRHFRVASRTSLLHPLHPRGHIALRCGSVGLGRAFAGRGFGALSIAALGVAAFSVTACTSATFGELPVEPSVVGERATLAPGQSATFGDTNELRVTFREIEADSRCPSDAQCVWAGDAAALFRIELGALIGGTTLHTTLEPKSIVIDAEHRLRLVSVSPEPRLNLIIPPSSYRVTIEVTRPD